MDNTEGTEIWKDVEESPIYEVSNFGRVKKKNNGRILKLQEHNGYKRVYLYVNGKQKKRRVHRLVAIAFIGMPKDENKLFVNHIDGNKSNNHVSNLEWVTHKENIYHAIKNKRIDCQFDYKKSLKRDVEKDVKVIRYLYETTEITHAELAELFYMNPSTIAAIVNNKYHKDVTSL